MVLLLINYPIRASRQALLLRAVLSRQKQTKQYQRKKKKDFVQGALGVFKKKSDSKMSGSIGWLWSRGGMGRAAETPASYRDVVCLDALK